jgi:hypothetical protein
MENETNKEQKFENKKLKTSVFFQIPFITRDPMVVQTPEPPILQSEYELGLKKLFPNHYKKLHQKMCPKTRNEYLECLKNEKIYKHDEIFENGNFESLLKEKEEKTCSLEFRYYHRCLTEAFKRNMIHITGVACTKELATYRYSDSERNQKKLLNCCEKNLKKSEKYFSN